MYDDNKTDKQRVIKVKIDDSNDDEVAIMFEGRKLCFIGYYDRANYISIIHYLSGRYLDLSRKKDAGYYVDLNRYVDNGYVATDDVGDKIQTNFIKADSKEEQFKLFYKYQKE